MYEYLKDLSSDELLLAIWGVSVSEFVTRPLTDNQEAPEPLINNQGALTDNQGSQARGHLIQILNNLYAKLVGNLRVLSQKLQPQALV